MIAVLMDGPAAGQEHPMDEYRRTVTVLVKAELPRIRFTFDRRLRRRFFVPVEVAYKLLAAHGDRLYYEYDGLAETLPLRAKLVDA